MAYILDNSGVSVDFNIVVIKFNLPSCYYIHL